MTIYYYHFCLYYNNIISNFKLQRRNKIEHIILKLHEDKYFINYTYTK